MADEAERLKILEMIDKGQISAQDGIRLLQALTGADENAAPEALPQPNPADTFNPPVETPPVDEPDRANELPLTEPSVPTSQSASSAEPEFVPASASEASERAEAPHFESEPEVIPPPQRFDPNQQKWRSFWWIPMLVGVGITLVAALLMFAAWNAGGFGFWFACTWFPFLLGVAVMALAWASRTARWLHVRIHQKEGESPQRIAISLPIPLRLTAWFLRTFGKYIPHLGNTGLDELIMALDATSPETPFYVEVNEGGNGERVEVYIG